MPNPCPHPEVRASVWAEFKRQCKRRGLDYRLTTLPGLLDTVVDQAAARADTQCLRMIAALQAADGRVRDSLIPLDDYLKEAS